LTLIGDYMNTKDKDKNLQVEQLKKLFKKTQALPQVQDLSEEAINAEVEKVRD